MKFIPGHVRNINGITPTEAVPFVSPAEEERVGKGLMRALPAQLAVAETVRLRVLPVNEEHMPKLTIREYKRVSEFAKWFMTLGRATSVVIDTESIGGLECSRHPDQYFSEVKKISMDNSSSWYDQDYDMPHTVTRSNTPARATFRLNAMATVPEYDDISVRLNTGHLMLSAPNSPLEKSGIYAFNMVYMEEL